MTSPRLFLLGILLLTSGNCFGGDTYAQMTRQQTLDSIRSITTSWYRYTHYDYPSDREGAWTVEISVPGNGLEYFESYREDGTLKSKGLYNSGDNPVGTWWFADTTGKIYKEYDYASRQNILYPGASDPYQWIFDSLAKSSQRLIEQRMGVYFTARHIHLVHITWYADNSGSEYSGIFPQMPRRNPNHYYVYNEIVYDSTVVSRLLLHYDSSLTFTEDPKERTWPLKRRLFDVGYDQATLMCANHGYDPPRLSWFDNFREYYWCTQKCEETEDPYDREDCDYINISAYTGKTIPYFMVYETTCSPSTEFKSYCHDTVIIPPGHKEVRFGGARFVVPLQWLVTSTYVNYGQPEYMTNGTDTIYGFSDCGRYIRAYMVQEKFDTVSMNAFKSHFPGGNIQGRSYSFVVLQRGEDNYDLTFEVLEPISALGCGTITSLYTANGINAKQRDAMMEILMTIHFSRCIPE